MRLLKTKVDVTVSAMEVAMQVPVEPLVTTKAPELVPQVQDTRSEVVTEPLLALQLCPPLLYLLLLAPLATG